MNENEKKDFDMELDKYVFELLINVGCRYDRAGFAYIKQAVIYFFKYGCCYGAFGRVCLKISNQYNKTPASVKRSIERSIERISFSSERNKINMVFHLPIYYADSGISAGEFIAVMVEQIKKKYVFIEGEVRKL